MKALRFSLILAARHLRSGGWQTVLITSGVAVAVVLVIFISGIITGVQKRIVDGVTGATAHITITAPERTPRVLPGAATVAEATRRPWQRETLDNWTGLERDLTAFPGVVAVSPGISAQAFAAVGGRSQGVRLLAADPAKHDRIVHLSDDVYQGTFLGLATGDAAIGYVLARDLGIGLGDRLRVSTTRGSTTVRIAGILNSGSSAVDDGFVFVPLRTGQQLTDAGSGVTTLFLAVDRLFEAEAIAQRIGRSFDLTAESWMTQNGGTLNGLRAQSASSLLISTFSLAAAGFAIASVLIVSVLKRSREIGILKSIGIKGRQILLVFFLEGLGIAVLGTGAGLALGFGLLSALGRIPQSVRIPGKAPEALFPNLVTPEMLIATAVATILVTVAASVIPARQAARLDPVEVIRRG